MTEEKDTPQQPASPSPPSQPPTPPDPPKPSAPEVVLVKPTPGQDFCAGEGMGERPGLKKFNPGE